MLDQPITRRGRKPGQSMRLTCIECGKMEMGMYAGQFSRCSACKSRGMKEETKRMYFDTSGAGFAHGEVKRAVDSGAMPPPTDFSCADCGVAATQYDHRDYSKPFDVEPVCGGCNKRRGPALPWPGHIAARMRRGVIPYRYKAYTEKLLEQMGVDTSVLNGMPRTLEMNHWQILLPVIQAAAPEFEPMRRHNDLSASAPVPLHHKAMS